MGSRRGCVVLSNCGAALRGQQENLNFIPELISALSFGEILQSRTIKYMEIWGCSLKYVLNYSSLN